MLATLPTTVRMVIPQASVLRPQPNSSLMGVRKKETKTAVVENEAKFAMKQTATTTHP